MVVLAAALIAGGACSSDSGKQTGAAGTSGGAGTSGSAGTSGGAGTSGDAGTSGNAGSGGSGGSGGSTGSGGAGGSGDGSFACGPTVRCANYRQYCFFESANGAVKVDYQCRAMPASCATCACARPDAVTASMLCTTPSRLTCRDGQNTIDDQTTTPSLNVWCLIP